MASNASILKQQKQAYPKVKENVSLGHRKGLDFTIISDLRSFPLS